MLDISVLNPHYLTQQYTATGQDLGMQYQPMATEHARGQYRGLVNMSKYGIFSGEPPLGKNEVQYYQWIFEVEDSWQMYEEVLVREAIIHSLRGKAAFTICYLGYNPSFLARIDKLNTVYRVVASYDILMQKFYQIIQEQGVSISNYLILIEGVLNDIKTKFPNPVTEMESDQLLQSRFYSALGSQIHNGMTDMFRNSAYDVTVLIKA